MEKTIKLERIVVDNDLNPREGELDQAAVLEYSQALDDLPLMEVFDIHDEGYVLAAGFHRYAAHQLAGRTEATFIVHRGNREEAGEYADLNNLTHGLRLTRKERRGVATRQVKRHPEWSDSRLAASCQTTDKTIRSIREELEATSEIPTYDTLIGADGIVRPRTVERAKPVEAPPGPELPGMEQGGEYAPIWQLEQVAQKWLNQSPGEYPGNKPITILEEIKRESQIGNQYLSDLSAKIISPHRLGDLRQACINILARMQEEAWEKEAKPDWLRPASEEGPDVLTPAPQPPPGPSSGRQRGGGETAPAAKPAPPPPPPPPPPAPKPPPPPPGWALTVTIKPEGDDQDSWLTLITLLEGTQIRGTVNGTYGLMITDVEALCREHLESQKEAA